MILLPDQVELVRVVHPGLSIAIEVDRYSIELRDCLLCIGVTAVDEAAGHLQHGAVKGEVGVEGSRPAELLYASWNPVGGGRGRRV